MHGLWSIENLRRKRGTEMHDAPDWGGGEEFIAWVLGYGYAAGHYKAPEAS